jgi:hypothetical protein
MRYNNNFNTLLFDKHRILIMTYPDTLAPA